jgi:hypothetical protein
MKPLTDQQKKWAWIAGAILLTVHFAPNVINAVHHAFTSPAPAVLHKPSPMQSVPPTLPPSPPPSPQAIVAVKYGGIWAGDALMPDQSRCTIRLEIRLSDEVPQKLKGYESKSCVPLQPLAGGRLSKGSIADVIRATSPVSAVMTGSAHQGGIRFSVDQTIGTAGDGCVLTSFTITDFGQGQVQAEWQESTCPSGRMLLRKARG